MKFLFSREAIINFTATFAGVFLGWIAAVVTDNYAKSNLFREQVEISRDYCKITASAIDDELQVIDGSPQRLGGVPYPETLLDYTKNSDFVERLDGRLRYDMLSLRVEAIGFLNSYNSGVKDYKIINKITSINSGKDVEISNSVKESTLKELKSDLENVHNRVLFLCYALRSQECKAGDLYNKTITRDVGINSEFMNGNCSGFREYMRDSLRETDAAK